MSVPCRQAHRWTEVRRSPSDSKTRWGARRALDHDAVVVTGRDDRRAAGPKDPPHLRQGGEGVVVGQEVRQGVVGAHDGVDAGVVQRQGSHVGHGERGGDAGCSALRGRAPHRPGADVGADEAVAEARPSRSAGCRSRRRRRRCPAVRCATERGGGAGSRPAAWPRGASPGRARGTSPPGRRRTAPSTHPKASDTDGGSSASTWPGQPPDRHFCHCPAQSARRMVGRDRVGAPVGVSQRGARNGVGPPMWRSRRPGVGVGGGDGTVTRSRSK